MSHGDAGLQKRVGMEKNLILEEEKEKESKDRFYKAVDVIRKIGF